MSDCRTMAATRSRPMPPAWFGPAAALLFGALLLGCQPQNQAPERGADVEPESTESQTEDVATGANRIASVNGQPITTAAFEHYLSQKQTTSTRPVDPASVLNEMINIELLSATAVEAGYDQRESVRLELDRQRKALLANLALEERLNAVEISQSELETAYQKQYVNADNTEYKASHILVESKEEAQSLIVELQGGAEFAELAREHSVGPSAPRGGDLGWFSVSDVVPEFAQAVVALENGAYTQDPVESQFGWHVIERVDSRTPEPPALTDIEDELRRALTTQRVADYLRDLREAAQIEIEGQAQ